MAPAGVAPHGKAISLARHVDVRDHGVEPVRAVYQASRLVPRPGFHHLEALIGESAVVQAPAPPRPIDGGLPTTALLAHIAAAKFAWHLPLHRQTQMLAGYGILKATAHTKLLNFASNLGGLVAFAAVGKPLWLLGAAMAVAQIAGATLGARLAMRIGARIIRPLLVAASTLLALRLIWQML